MASTISRRARGLIALALGVLLAIAATLGLISGGSRSVGDVTGVEEALRGSPAAEPAPPERPAAVETVPPTSAHPTPLWQPNGERMSPPVLLPVRLHIAAIGVDTAIVPYGVDRATGQMEVPDNVSEVAWYQYGPTPGQPGSAVLAAHVDMSGEGPGVFFHLGDLEIGDVIQVELDDGSDLAFTVEARTTYPKESLPLEVIFSEEGPAVLTLVTCGGGFDSSTSRYDSNVVVYAGLVQEPPLKLRPAAETPGYPPSVPARAS